MSVSDTSGMTRTPDKLRRSGYAPATNAGVGRRGLHTRDRILGCAAEVFLANGFHATSLDAIAKAAGASRATVYQYFAGKEEIFRELSALAERAVLAHGEHLRDLGPTVDGMNALHRWLVEWADIYDAHAAVFAEFPGIGTATGLSVVDAITAADQFDQTVTESAAEDTPAGSGCRRCSGSTGPDPPHGSPLPAPGHVPAARSRDGDVVVDRRIAADGVPETPAECCGRWRRSRRMGAREHRHRSSTVPRRHPRPRRRRAHRFRRTCCRSARRCSPNAVTTPSAWRRSPRPPVSAARPCTGTSAPRTRSWPS